VRRSRCSVGTIVAVPPQTLRRLSLTGAPKVPMIDSAPINGRKKLARCDPSIPETNAEYG
jgi:hypothetical protein